MLRNIFYSSGTNDITLSTQFHLDQSCLNTLMQKLWAFLMLKRTIHTLTVLWGMVEPFGCGYGSLSFYCAWLNGTWGPVEREECLLVKSECWLAWGSVCCTLLVVSNEIKPDRTLIFVYYVPLMTLTREPSFILQEISRVQKSSHTHLIQPAKFV
jgi:hypothetical protein